jgi:hypothetical protein
VYAPSDPASKVSFSVAAADGTARAMPKSKIFGVPS